MIDSPVVERLYQLVTDLTSDREAHDVGDYEQISDDETERVT
jgi:hypothetical protein